MMRRIALLLVLPALLGAAPAAKPVLVRLDTSLGPITIALEMKRAPITAGNFLRYVENKRLDGTTFYRAARSKHDPQQGLVQGGIDHKLVRSFFPIAHEPTSKTRLHHGDGVVSMARNDPGTAMGDFFICIGPNNGYLDAAPNYPGYAAFGHVVAGMPVVKRILALKTYPGGYSAQTKGQSIIDRAKILSARRVG